MGLGRVGNEINNLETRFLRENGFLLPFRLLFVYNPLIQSPYRPVPGRVRPGQGFLPNQVHFNSNRLDPRGFRRTPGSHTPGV